MSSDAAAPAIDTSERSRAFASETHEEWLIDEALAESFPASDPPSTSYPGSAVTQVTNAGAQSASRPQAGAQGWAIATATALIALGLLLARRSRRERRS